MQAVRTRFGDNVYDAAGIPAVAGAVVARLHAELLKGIREGEGLVGVGIKVVVVGAIKAVADLVLTRAICGYGH